MSGAGVLSSAVQLVGGIAAAPLLPGLIQHWKARLQGRRGPSPLQPYRELRRLWGKSTVTPEGTTALYRFAPAVAAAAVAAAVLIVPVSEAAPSLGLGRDVLALVGLLALARFAVAVASWDVANGFALMGASRDLTLSVFVETTLVVSVAVAALAAGTTDLGGIVGATAGTHVWTTPALALAALGFALVARHWLVLVLAAQTFLPHLPGALLQLALLPVVLGFLCAALALCETLLAKMRILLVPRLIAVGALASLLGIAAWLAESR